MDLEAGYFKSVFVTLLIQAWRMHSFKNEPSSPKRVR